MTLPQTPPTGHPILHIILNTGSGRDDAGQVQALIGETLHTAGREHLIHPRARSQPLE
ncbi:hypothetical protein L499_A0054 [Bordetella holmesii CDC-H635-BH]|nr:hypothetical protein D558_2190 [Bordetella holmesii 44057]KAK89094.1 hypothetical protein L499_A0054 [Bordetella holmesii CDC-H635-BH]